MSRDFLGYVFDEIAGNIPLAQLRLYIPLPFGDRTKAHTVPDAQQEPASRRNQNGKEMGSSRSFRYPSEKVEQNNGQVNDRQGYIEKVQHRK